MKIKKEYTCTLGLLLITVWSALQYIFLQNVPDTVSTFSFMFITNLVGFAVLVTAQFRKLKQLNKKILLKGLILTLELIGYNFFLILGSRGLDSVIVSSIVSMYFIFVTPMLVLMKKQVSFRSAIASMVAIISLLLMFNADLNMLFSSKNVIFLIIADLFFASYIITIPIVGKNEDSSVLTISQMIFSCIFSFIGWSVETGIGMSKFSFPRDAKFWVSVYGCIHQSIIQYLADKLSETRQACKCLSDFCIRNYNHSCYKSNNVKAYAYLIYTCYKLSDARLSAVRCGSSYS